MGRLTALHFSITLFNLNDTHSTSICYSAQHSPLGLGTKVAREVKSVGSLSTQYMYIPPFDQLFKKKTGEESSI